jgi:hypothetical protein
MPINEENCYICGAELSTENYYYIATGRLQQGVMSDPKAYKEYALCTNCYAMVNAELIVSIQKRKTAASEKK